MEDIGKRYAANHYVLVDDKLGILTTMKEVWESRVTTIFPRQGHYANDPRNGETYPPPDITIGRIGDLLQHDLLATIAGDTGDAFKNAGWPRETSL
jgi:hypothetical protein